MKDKYSKEIDDLFTSTGIFEQEYVEFLDKLSIENQKKYITELYKRVTTSQFNRLRKKNNFGVDNSKGEVVHRYSNYDLEEAKKGHPQFDTSSAILLKGLGKSEKEITKYRASYIFIERKEKEIEFVKEEIGRFYYSIINRIKITNTFEKLIDYKSIFKDVSFDFLRYPPNFNKRNLRIILEKIKLNECFDSEDYYRFFLMNSFALYTEKEKPIVLSIPLTKKNKVSLQKKIHQLYSCIKNNNIYSDGIAIYPEYKVFKKDYAKILMCNFSNYRINNGIHQTFDNILENTNKKILK